MKKRIFVLLSISFLLVFLCDAQIPNYLVEPINIIKISNEFNSGYSLSGLNIKQGTTDYLDNSTYTFSDTKTGSSKDVQLMLKNISTSLIAILSSVVVGEGFTKTGSLPSILDAGDSVYFTIRFTPTAVKQFTGNLNITTNNSDDQYYQLNFAGISTSVGIYNPERNNLCKIYPNPIYKSAVVKLNFVDQSNISFVLLNATGQKVFNTLVPKGKSGFLLERNNLPSGIYPYLIFDEQKGLLNSGKVIME